MSIMPFTKIRGGMYRATCTSVALFLLINQQHRAARSLAAGRGPHLVETFSNESSICRVPPVPFSDGEVFLGGTGIRAVNTLGKKGGEVKRNPKIRGQVPVEPM